MPHNINALSRLESNDPLATFESSLDGGQFQPCASPKDYTDLPLAARSFPSARRSRGRLRRIARH